MNDMHLTDRQYSFAAVDHARFHNEIELHPAEVVSVAEARAAAITVLTDIFPNLSQPEQLEVPDLAVGLAGLVHSVNTLAAMVNRLNDENDYLRRRIERLEGIKGS